MYDMMTKAVTRSSGMSADAVGCSERSDAWPDNNGYYQL